MDRRCNPEILYIGGVACIGPDGMQQFVWAQTPKGDFIVAFGDTEEQIVVYTHDDFLKKLEG